MMRASHSLMNRLADASALGASVLVLFLSVLTVVDVVIRAAFNSTVPAISDIALFAILLITAMCLPACSAQGEHIRMAALGGALKGRWQLIIEAFAALVSFGYIALLAFVAVSLGYEYLLSGRVASILPIPVAPFWIAAAVFVVLTAVAQAFAVFVPPVRKPDPH